MKTYAGDLRIVLPGDWDDESEYAYRDSETGIEVRVESSPVDTVSVPRELIEPMVDRLGLLGPLENLKRGEAKVQDQEAATLSVSCRRDGDDEMTLMQVMVFKPSASRAVTISALAEQGQKAKLKDIWRILLDSLQVVEIA